MTKVDQGLHFVCRRGDIAIRLVQRLWIRGFGVTSVHRQMRGEPRHCGKAVKFGLGQGQRFLRRFSRRAGAWHCLSGSAGGPRP